MPTSHTCQAEANPGAGVPYETPKAISLLISCYCPFSGPPGPIPADHVMLRRADLAKAADGAVAALVALLKRPAVDTLNGPLRIVAVQVGAAFAIRACTPGLTAGSVLP